MALKIDIGQYLAKDSFVHSLDARTKVGCVLAIMISVFFIQTPLQLALGFAFICAVLAASKIPVSRMAESVRPLVFVLLVLSVFNLLFTRTGSVVVSLGQLLITTDGVRAALLYSLRLIIGVVAGLLILLTTTPTQLTDAFDAMLSPLAKIGVPAHEIAMVFSLMLRFIPTLAQEAQAVVDAQTARGGALAEGSLIKRIRSAVPILVALLASSLHHANGLSRALDARCYEGGTERSRWHPLKMHATDALAIAVTTAYVAVLIALRLI